MLRSVDVLAVAVFALGSTVTAPALAATLKLVSMHGFTLNEIGANTDRNPFLLDEDTRLATDSGYTGVPGRVETSATYETPQDEDYAEPPFQSATSVAFADLRAGKTGMKVEADSETYDEAFISFAATGLIYGFLYEGDADLVLPTGWLSMTVDGTWGGGMYDYTVASNAGLLATVTTGLPLSTDENWSFESGPRVDAVTSDSNTMFGAFFAFAPAYIRAAEGSTGSADENGFMFSLLADGMTVKNGQFLSFYLGHNISSGVRGTSAFVDALSTASVGLNVLGLATVDTGPLGPVSWINDAPAPSEGPAVVPLPAAGWLMVACLGCLAGLKRRSRAA